MKVSETRTCRYCGHQGKAKGANAPLCKEGMNNCLVYACKDADACGTRIRAQKGVTLEGARADGSPF